MTSPYINTKLYTTVTLHPSQMNNNIYLNLKKNLTEEINKRCFGEYGYLVDIYEIMSFDDNTMEAENTMASAVYDISFACRLCKPLKNTKIICEVVRVNKVLLMLKNGPITVIVASTDDRVNPTVFFRDSYRNLRYKDKDGERSHVIQLGDYVKVSLVQTTFNSGEEQILAIGYLEAMASEEEIKNYYNEQYNEGEKFMGYDEYMNPVVEEDNNQLDDDENDTGGDNYSLNKQVSEDTVSDEDSLSSEESD